MKHSITRRDALKGIASSGTLALIKPASAILPESPLVVASSQVEVTVTSISARTVRITVQALKEGRATALLSDGALVREDWGQPTARMRTLGGNRTLKSGDLHVSVSDSPLTIHVEEKNGRVVQNLTLDSDKGELRFNTGTGLLLGLGQGGPQFDRRSDSDSMVSGQGGYHLDSHGARVPIQFLIGTEGWGMYVHSPLGAFDLGGGRGRLRTSNGEAALPLDVFVIGASRPVDILAEYARITGLPEMPPLWSLGYQQSYRTLGSPEEIMHEALTFREKRLPCDSMIYLGTGFCPNGWNTDNGEFMEPARLS